VRQNTSDALYLYLQTEGDVIFS